MLPAPEPPADAAPPGQNGLAELTLELRAGSTRLTRVRTRPPLLVQRALYPDDAAPGMAYVLLANPTGGLLANDRQQISVAVGSGAQAHITTQSATKIYTMEQGQAEQRVTLSVAAGGYLEYLPDPLIPFRGAKLAQDITITLEPGAALVSGDIITPGRVAGGEAFAYRQLSSRLVVYRQPGRATYREAFQLAPNRDAPMRTGALGRLAPPQAGAASPTTFASMLALCDATPARAVLNAIRLACQLCGGAIAGASLLPDGNGVGVKIVGAERQAVQSAATQIWYAARRQLIGARGPDLRKY